MPELTPEILNKRLHTAFIAFMEFVKDVKDPLTINPAAHCQFLKEHHLPEAQMMGYPAEKNPVARIGKENGGHYFLLLHERYIVDLWYKYVYAPDAPLFLDIQRERDISILLYGPPANWVKLSN